MPKETRPLTDAELADLERRRAAARERARRLPPLSPEEDAAIEAAAADDPDAKPLSEAELDSLRPAHEVRPALVAEALRRPRGRPRLQAPKRQVTLRLDQDVIDYYRSSGAGWQSRINDILRKAAGRGSKGAFRDEAETDRRTDASSARPREGGDPDPSADRLDPRFRGDERG